MGQAGDVVSQAREIGLDVASARRCGLAGFPPGVLGGVADRIRYGGHLASLLCVERVLILILPALDAGGALRLNWRHRLRIQFCQVTRALVEIDQSCAIFLRLNIMAEFMQCSEHRLSDMGSST